MNIDGDFLVGIPTYNGHARVEALLQNLRQRTPADIKHTIVVCDDSGKASHQQLVRAACEKYGASYIQNDRNRGVPASWNALVQSHRTQYAILLNDDVLVAKGWLKHIGYALSNNPQVGSFSMNCLFITQSDVSAILAGPDAQAIPLNVHYRDEKLIRDERFPSMPLPGDGSPGRVMCLPPGQTIVTDRGLIPIEDVCVDDRVFSHKGRWCRVLKTIRNDYEGLLYKILPSRVNLPFTVTEDHPILVASGEKCNYHKGYCTPKKAELCREHSEERLPKEMWTSPRDLPSGAFLMLPRTKKVTMRTRLDLADGIELPEVSRWSIADNHFRLRGAHARTLPRRISITPDLLRFFGLFVAEGSTCLKKGGSVKFTFHKREKHLYDFVRDVAKKVFGLKSSIYRVKRNDHSISVNINCLPLALAMRHLFGEKANQKRVPWWIMELPPYLQVHLTDGMFEGDGGYSIQNGFQRTHYDTVSPLLAWQFFQLLCRQGILSTFSRTSRKPTNENWQDIYHFTMTQNPQGGFMDEMYVYLPIREVTEFAYRGPVYNLAVEEDESYCVPASAVHNCPAGCFFGFRREMYDAVGGFDEQYFAFYEELDFGVACAEKGFPTFTLPVPHDNYHLWSATFATAPEINAGKVMVESRQKFVWKWSARLGVRFSDAPEIHNLLMDKIPKIQVKWIGLDGSERSELL